MNFFRYAISFKEFTFTASDMVSKLKLNVKPTIFGKLLASYKKELERNGLVVECNELQQKDYILLNIRNL